MRTIERAGERYWRPLSSEAQSFLKRREAEIASAEILKHTITLMATC